MMRQRGSSLMRVLMLSLVFTGGCDGCRQKLAPLAVMVERNGDNVRRDHARQREQWETAEVGAEFRLGDGARTDVASSALLSLVDGSKLQMRPSTMIRFMVDDTVAGEQGIDVLAGEAWMSAGASELRLRTHVGLAVISAGGQITLAREGEGLRLQVDVGEARFNDGRGQPQRITSGDGVSLQVGMAMLRRSSAHGPDGGPSPSAVDLILADVKRAGVGALLRGEQTWRELEPGAHALAAGTGLRLPAGTLVDLTRGQDHAQLKGAGEYVVGDGVLVEARRGDLQIDAQQRDVQIRVPGGLITVRAANGGSDAVVHVGADDGAIDVQRGLVTFKDSDGSRDLAAGKHLRWSHAPAAESDPAVAEATDEGATDYSNFEIRAGESFVVHAPEVPVAVRFEFASKCKGAGVVEVAGNRRSRGTGHANLSLLAGARSYTLRCIDARGAPGKVAARGTAHVLRDAGTRDLPARAPTSQIDADGHNYTIYYQNQLPEVRVRWPHAPDAPSYRLLLDDTAMSLSSPEHLFPSGSLRDGTHRLTFEAGERRSRTANVEVRFDNTAPTASLIAPIDRSFSPGETTTVEGVALRAWKVSVQGGTIEKVGDDRFRGQVATSAQSPDIAVKLTHPRLGTHYYLRRAAGSP